MVGTYTGTRFLDAAVEYINTHDATAPLFMYLALHNTHAPIEALPEDLVLYNSTYPSLQARYYGMMTAVDRTVGAVTAALKAKGLWEDTLLVWTTGAFANKAPLCPHMQGLTPFHHPIRQWRTRSGCGLEWRVAWWKGFEVGGGGA